MSTTKPHPLLHTVAAADDGARLERLLKRDYPQLAFSQIQKFCRSGVIRVNGNKVKHGHRLAAGDTLGLPAWLADESLQQNSAKALSKSAQEALKNAVLYEDDALVVLNKPAGISVQGGSKVKGSLDEQLSTLYGEAVKPVHRLDRDTTGVLVFARTREAAAHLHRQFKLRSVQKVYMCVCVGKARRREGEIDAPLHKMTVANQQRMVVAAPGTPGADPARTTYAVLHREDETCVVEACPHTGRTHQIRVHLAHIGLPLVGDGKYGVEPEHPLCLHAYTLTFTHPQSGREVTFRATIPEHMRVLVPGADWGLF